MRRRQLPGEPEPPSKGELKRRAQAAQELGERLIESPDALLAAVPLPDALREAILQARTITSRAALVRQRQYIGKLMRQVDEAPIRAALEARESAGRLEALRFRQVEQWRERILAEGDTAIDALARERAGIDPQRLRSLAAEARRQQAEGAAPRAARELFRVLRAALDGA